MKRKGLGLFFLCILIFTGCGPNNIKSKILPDMAKLDQVFIPAFVFTSLNRQPESLLAFDRFKQEWQVFYDKYRKLEIKYGLDIVDEQWPENFVSINSLVQSVEAFVQAKKLAKANSQLLQIRTIMFDLRQRHGWPYFLDNLADYDLTVQQMTALLKGKSKLTNKDLRNLETLTDLVEKKWAKVSSSRIEAKFFHFDRKKTKALAGQIKKQKAKVSDLPVIVKQGKLAAIITAVQGLKPGYTTIYKAFGDFKPVFDRVAKQKQSSYN